MTTVKIEIYREVEVIVDEEGADDIGRLDRLYIPLTEDEREEAWEKYAEYLAKGGDAWDRAMENKGDL